MIQDADTSRAGQRASAPDALVDPDDVAEDFYAARGPIPDDDDVEAAMAGTSSASAGVLRRLGKPPSWSTPTSPESLLGPQYASAARRARVILRRMSTPAES